MIDRIEVGELLRNALFRFLGFAPRVPPECVLGKNDIEMRRCKPVAFCLEREIDECTEGLFVFAATVDCDSVSRS